MAKDFAFLFYVNDWAGGTQWLTRLQRGGYLDLLLYQVNNTSFSLEEAKQILGPDFENIWNAISGKFKNDNGKFYHLKMRAVLESRSKFTESRRGNRLGKTKTKKARSAKKEIKSELTIEQREQKFKESLYPFIGEHPKERVKSFFDYWSEKTTGGLKMRFELQKTWEAKKRLATWAKNEKQNINGKSIYKKSGHDIDAALEFADKVLRGEITDPNFKRDSE